MIGPAIEILVLITYLQTPPSSAHADLFIRTSGLNFSPIVTPTLRVQALKALASMGGGCLDSSEPSLLTYAISSKMAINKHNFNILGLSFTYPRCCNFE